MLPEIHDDSATPVFLFVLLAFFRETHQLHARFLCPPIEAATLGTLFPHFTSFYLIGWSCECLESKACMGQKVVRMKSIGSRRPGIGLKFGKERPEARCMAAFVTKPPPRTRATTHATADDYQFMLLAWMRRAFRGVAADRHAFHRVAGHSRAASLCAWTPPKPCRATICQSATTID